MGKTINSLLKNALGFVRESISLAGNYCAYLCAKEALKIYNECGLNYTNKFGLNSENIELVKKSVKSWETGEIL